MKTAKTEATGSHKDIYALVTDKIIEAMERGVVPWKRAWEACGIPMNYITKRAYSGINLMLLSLLSFERPYFLTFKQVQTLGGRVKKGAKGWPVVFWKLIEANKKTDKENKQEEKIPLLKLYYLFNVEDIEGISFKFPEDNFKPKFSIEACEQIVSNMPISPTIVHANRAKAYYSPSRDIVNIPQIEQFATSENYYKTLFHELVHATGHPSRLNRKTVVDAGRFGDESHSKEELIAEIGAAFLYHVAGIATQGLVDYSAAYVQNWLAALKNDKRLIVEAASQAQKAVNYILNLNPQEGEEQEETKAELQLTA